MYVVRVVGVCRERYIRSTDDPVNVCGDENAVTETEASRIDLNFRVSCFFCTR